MAALPGRRPILAWAQACGRVPATSALTRRLISSLVRDALFLDSFEAPHGRA